MGLADLLTTLVGITYFGAVEINPLFAGLTQTNLAAFSAIKLAATLLIGFLFYKAYQIEETQKASFRLEKRFLQSGYFLSLAALTVVVTNNILAAAAVL
jgi:aconitase B